MTSFEEQHGDYHFIAVSDIGINHRIKGIPNQDAVLFHSYGENFMLAVSDGVGSCNQAELGSRYAVEATKSVFRELLSGTLSDEPLLVAETLIQIWREQISYGKEDDYCATLKAAIMINRDLLMISIGDGILAMTSMEVQIIAPIDSEFFANQTNCFNRQVKATDFWIRKHHLDYNIPYVVFACTDGIANNIQEGREIDLVREIEAHCNPQNLKSEIETLVVDISEYSSDDRTIGVVKYERKDAELGR